MSRTAGERAQRGPLLTRLDDQSAELLAYAPGHQDVRELRAGILGAQGDFEQESGRNDHAESLFREALAIRESLAEAHPADQTLRLALSISVVRVGDAALEAG